MLIKKKFYSQSKDYSRHEVNIDSNSLSVLFVGNLVKIKGPDVLLSAWQILTDNWNKDTFLKLFFIGQGPLLKALQQQANNLGIEKTVRFIGQVPHDKIPVWMNAVNCLCLSSLHEGMPNVILEAMATGLKVVATDVGACRFLLQKYPLGRIVPPQNPNALATAMNELLSTQLTGKTIEKYIEQLPTWLDQAKLILNLMGIHR